MRTILTPIFFICFGPCIAFGQEKKKTIEKDSDNLVFVKVEHEAHPDMAAWTKYLNQHTKLPESIATEIPPGSYTVVVAFIVDIYGAIIDVKAEKDPGYGLGAIAVKTIKNYKGKWTPANQCGRSVKAYRRQPITYTITAE